LVGLLAAIGLCGGVVFGILRPPAPSATALVLLPPTNVTSSGAPTRDVATEIGIAKSAPVLTAAGKSVKPALGYTAMEKLVSVTAPSQDILSVQAHGPTGPEAERLANAVANEYIQFVTTQSANTTNSAVTGLQQQSSQLTQQIQQLQTQINTVTTRLATEGASSPSGQQDSSLLGSLSAEQQQISLEIDNINTRIASTQVAGTSQTTPQGTQLLQRATFYQAPSKSFIAFAGGLGLVMGLLVGIIVALVKGRRDRRLFTRREISRAIDVPVLGSLRADRHDTSNEWSTLFENYSPDGVDAWNLRSILGSVVPEDAVGPTQVRVVSLEGDGAAMAVGPQLALFANNTGTPVGYSADAHPFVETLRAVATIRRTFDWEVAHGVNGNPGPLTIRTVVVGPDRATLDASSGPCVLAVSAGFASADELARVALAASDSGHPLDGMVVVNPYPSDNTTGVSPSAVRTSGSSTIDSFSSATNGRQSGAYSTPTAPSNGSAHGVDRDADDSAEDVAGTFVSLRVIRAAARRHWKFMVVVPLVGLLIGAGFHLVIPRKYAANTSLFLTEPSTSDPAQAMANDVSLLQTRPVALGAIAQLHLHTNPETFLASYQGQAVSNTILSINFSANSPEAAVAGANAVSRSFLDVRTRELGIQTNAVVNDLQSQIDALNSEIDRLGPTIDVLSSSPSAQQSQGAELASLIAQRNEDSSQVTQLEGEIQQNYLNAKSVTGASQILAPAVVVPVSAKKVAVMDGLSGLVAGLGVALMVLVISTLLSDRLRTRAEAAEALNAPVELSVRRFPRRRRSSLRSLRRLLAHPNQELVMMDRRLRDHVDALAWPALAVVSVEAGDAAALAVASAASSLVREGRSVVAVDLAPGRPLAKLLARSGAGGAPEPVAVRGQSVTLMVGVDDPADSHAMGMLVGQLGAGEVLLVLTGADPALGAEHLAMWVSESVVLIDVRKASGEFARACAELLRRARIRIRSVIVIGSDPHDTSVGAREGADEARQHPAETALVTARR
jgi:capsular polysaccharide biosynthesis protein